jgi:hypothetical protein
MDKGDSIVKTPLHLACSESVGSNWIDGIGYVTTEKASTHFEPNILKLIRTM